MRELPTGPYGEPLTTSVPHLQDGTLISAHIEGRAVQVEQKPQSPLTKVEAGLYGLLTLSEAEINAAGFQPIETEDGTLVGYRDIELPENDFMRELIVQRMASFSDIEAILERIDALRLPGLERAREYGRFRPPVIFLGVDHLHCFDFTRLGFSANDMELALEQAPNWKASPHIILVSEQQQAHDYPSYATETAKALGMTRANFIRKQQGHEAFHPFIDDVAAMLGHPGSSGFTEGICDLVVGFEARATHMLEPFLGREPFMLEAVLTSPTQAVRYGESFFLFRAIAKAMGSGDELIGIAKYLSQLHSLRGRLPLLDSTKKVLNDNSIWFLPIKYSFN